MDRDLYFFLLAFSFFLGALFFIYRYIKYREKENYLREKEDYKIENKKLKEKLRKNQEDMEDYFLTWLHQIKTPITAIKMTLHDFEESSLPEIQIRMVEIEKYVSMAFSFSKLYSPSRDMDFSEISLDEILSPLLKQYRHFFIYSQISLDYQPIQEKGLTDSQWTRIQVEQILSNALKYTSTGGKIKLTYNKATQTLKIQDNGRGIVEEDLERIFQKGYVGFNGRLQEKSSGLGLFLAQKIGERLHQKVWVESKLGKGSSFYISFQKKET